MHNTCIPVNGSRLRGWKHDFPLKIDRRLFLLSHYHSSVTWPGQIFCQKLRKGCPLSYAKKITAIRPAVQWPFQKCSLRGVTSPLHWRGSNAHQVKRRMLPEKVHLQTVVSRLINDNSFILLAGAEKPKLPSLPLSLTYRSRRSKGTSGACLNPIMAGAKRFSLWRRKASDPSPSYLKNYTF